MRQCLFLPYSVRYGVKCLVRRHHNSKSTLSAFNFIKLFLPPYIFGPHNKLVREQVKYYTPFIGGEIEVQSN